MTTEPTKVMTPAATATYDAYIAAGWTDTQLVEHGLMEPRATSHEIDGDDRLRLLIERAERLEEERKGISDDLRDVFAEAKAVGYDPKIMRQLIRLRKMDPNDRAEMEMILDTYKAATGMA